MAHKDNYISSGCTLVNLACTGMTRYAYKMGDYILCVGDSNTGKTYLALACLAEASINPVFDDYRLIYDGPEGGAQMDIVKCFGQRLADRIELLTPGDGASDSLEEMYDKTDDDFKKGPCIRVVDSFDALITEEDEEQVADERKAREEGKKAKGSYAMSKAKKNSQRLRIAASNAIKSKSIFFAISQTRDNIGFGSQFNPKTRSGGKSLKFYAQIEMWLSSKGNIDAPYKGKKVQIGHHTIVKVQRSRHTGKKRDAYFPIYHSTGIDDIGSMIDFLVEWKHWKGTSETIKKAPEFKFSGSKEDLAQKIDKDGTKPKLRKIVGEVWRDIESKCKVERSNPYASREDNG